MRCRRIDEHESGAKVLGRRRCVCPGRRVAAGHQEKRQLAAIGQHNVQFLLRGRARLE